MSKMEKEFIPYELALELDKLGFNESCMLAYHPDLYLEEEEGTITPEFYEDGITNEKLKYITIELNEEETITAEGFIDSYTAPTWHQAFRWFREKYNLVCIVFNDDGDIEHDNIRFNWEIRVITHSFKNMKNQKNACLGEYNYKTYDEAEIECLKKLIKIVKKK